MSMYISPSDQKSIKNKLDLAASVADGYCVDYEEMSNEILRSVFEAKMDELEGNVNWRINNEIREAYWRLFKVDKLTSLNTLFLHQFCTKILLRFNNQEIIKMLLREEDGRSQSKLCKKIIKDSYKRNELSIAKALKTKAISLVNEETPMIIGTLKNLKFMLSQ